VTPLTILHTESSLGWGGQEIRIVQEARAVSKRGHRVLIAAQPESLLLDEARRAGFEVFPVAMARRSFPRAFARMLGIIRRQRVDIVNTHSSQDSWVASLAGRLSRRRPWVIRTRHVSVPVRWGGVIYGRLPDRVITTGEEMRRMLIAETGVREDRIVSIPTGVDADRFHPGVTGRFREQLGIPKDVCLVGMVSVLRSWKGHRYFLEAAARVRHKAPGARFVVVGEGPMRPLIEQWRQELGLKDDVTMTGYRTDIPEVLSALDLLVLPSTGNEGVPQAILQAMAMAKPVVASDIGGIREAVTPGQTGVLVPPRDPIILADRIIDLLNDRAAHERMGRRAREIAMERWTLDRMVERVLAVYEGLGRTA